jgi:hypothetical protein
MATYNFLADCVQGIFKVITADDVASGNAKSTICNLSKVIYVLSKFEKTPTCSLIEKLNLDYICSPMLSTYYENDGDLEKIYIAACGTGNISVLQWIDHIDTSQMTRDDAYMNQISSDHIDVMMCTEHVHIIKYLAIRFNFDYADYGTNILQCLCEANYLTSLQWMLNEYPISNTQYNELFWRSIPKSQLGILKYIYSSGKIQLGLTYSYTFKKMCQVEKKIEILQWLHTFDASRLTNCIGRAFTHACKADINYVQWLYAIYSNGANDDINYVRGKINVYGGLICACENGEIIIFEWLMKQVPRMLRYMSQFFLNALYASSITMLDHLYDKYQPDIDQVNMYTVLSNICLNCDIEPINWLYAKYKKDISRDQWLHAFRVACTQTEDDIDLVQAIYVLLEMTAANISDEIFTDTLNESNMNIAEYLREINPTLKYNDDANREVAEFLGY